ncbi:hypothetical protein [Glycomyces sp. NRRL B-16210]|uniref:hypothetical protein n=1 Tax=Glycomyces sp. NRRL B-16210 TaxID=1463821 RepID=UPI0005577109|nr:hypothetical protein [Glycomyces sp. NRRL B-16210]
MEASNRTDHRLNRASLIFGIIASLATVAATLAAFFFNGQAQQSEDEAGTLRDDVESLRAERDQLSEEIVALESQLEQPITGETASTAVTLDFDDNLALDNCTNYSSSGGHWNSRPVRLAGEEYVHAFSCVPYSTNSTPANQRQSVGYVDFAVPAGAERLTGLAGIADDSADTSMIVEFVVHPVPETGEPLFSQTLKYGEVEEFDLDVTEHGRVRFQVEVIDTQVYGDLTDNTATASWAEVRFS